VGPGDAIFQFTNAEKGNRWKGFAMDTHSIRKAYFIRGESIRDASGLGDVMYPPYSVSTDSCTELYSSPGSDD